MARTRQTRMPSRLGKRKRFNAGGSRFKRRRFNKRKSWSTTSKSGVAASYRFRARKLSKRSWNALLWKSTLQKSHFRSNAANTAVLNTNALAGTSNVAIINALQSGANAFWTSLGGTLPIDTGAAVPNFNGDIILRGGTVGLTMANDTADATPQRVELFLVKSGDDFAPGGFPAAVPLGYDPTLFPDFNNLIGRIIMRKEILLENVNAADVKFRLPIRKIDQAEYGAGVQSYHWIIFVNSPSGTSSTITVTNYFNLSFSADAV